MAKRRRSKAERFFGMIAVGWGAIGILLVGVYFYGRDFSVAFVGLLSAARAGDSSSEFMLWMLFYGPILAATGVLQVSGWIATTLRAGVVATLCAALVLTADRAVALYALAPAVVGVVALLRIPSVLKAAQRSIDWLDDRTDRFVQACLSTQFRALVTVAVAMTLGLAVVCVIAQVRYASTWPYLVFSAWCLWGTLACAHVVAVAGAGCERCGTRLLPWPGLSVSSLRTALAAMECPACGHSLRAAQETMDVKVLSLLFAHFLVPD